jgi:inner membrane protein
MASIGHIAIGMAAARAYPQSKISAPQLAGAMGFWSALSLLPDADVIAFKLGIPYHAPWGHRGATHSFVFCLALALVVALIARVARLPMWRTFVVAAVVLVSHPLLDVMTDGGLGCALYWPFENTRHFAPWNPIPVAPIGKAFFSSRGLRIALTELLMFSPLILYALWPRSRANP